MKKVRILGFFALVAIACFILKATNLFAQSTDQITVTSYYPSPFGVYSSLKLSPNTTAPVVCNSSNYGTIYFDGATNALKVCADYSGSGQWGGGGIWERNTTSGDIYPKTLTDNLGIGTASPAFLLEVNGSENSFTTPSGVTVSAQMGVGHPTYSGRYLLLDSTDAQRIMTTNDLDILSGGAVNIATGNPLLGNTRLVIDTAGNVGIGATSPGQKLDVVGTIRATVADYTSGLFLKDNTPSTSLSPNLTFADSQAAGEKRLHLRKSGTQLQLIDNGGAADVVLGTDGAASYFYNSGGITGNVGIGAVPDANYKLDILATDATALRIYSGGLANYTAYAIGRTAAEGELGVCGSGGGHYSNIATSGDVVLRSDAADLILAARPTNGAIRFATRDSGGTEAERVTIIGSGNVGIGTTSPASKLSVGANGVSTAIIYGESAAASAIAVNGKATGASGVGVFGDATNSGGVGVRGNGAFGFYGTGTSYGVYTTASAGVGVSASGTSWDFYAAGPGVDYGTSSSIRWKRNIKPLDQALKKILNLRGVYFDWDKDHGGKHGMGMIAEEVGKEVPEIVIYEPDGKYATGMDYGKLTPVLVEAIKEQQKQIDELKEEIEKLKTKK